MDAMNFRDPSTGERFLVWRGDNGAVMCAESDGALVTTYIRQVLAYYRERHNDTLADHFTPRDDAPVHREGAER